MTKRLNDGIKELIYCIDELKDERDNLKEIVFDLMFEKQKASGPVHYPEVEISAELQQEFYQKHSAVDQIDARLKTLLDFANEQIKSQAKEIARLRKLVPEGEAAPSDAQTE